jgi:hypothetical protein
VCALVTGCDSFEDIRPGKCGNNIVEPARGEDCDHFDRAGMACRSENVGDPLECRFDCRLRAPDGSLAANAAIDPGMCSAGWTCGLDGVCRSSSGGFETVGIPLQESAIGLIPGDFNGDTHVDVLSVGTAGISVHFLDQGGAYAQSVHVPISNAQPAVGDLSGDGIDDFTMSTSVGLGVQRGQTSRDLEPVAFPIFVVPDVDGLRLFPVVLPAVLGEEEGVALFAIAKVGDTWALTHAGVPGFRTLTSKTITHTVVGPTASTLPCDKIAVAFANPASIEIHAPCDEFGNPASPGAQPSGFPQIVKLASEGFTPRRFFFRDRNADGVLDLVISAVTQDDPPTYEIEVALGDFSGNYGPPSPIPTKSELLAIGDLDGNAEPDFVFGDGVYLKGGAKEYVVKNEGERWTEAVIADLDLNNQLDVIAASDRRPNLDFLSSYDVNPGSDPPPTFTRFLIPTLGGAELLTTGNFDGDLLPDVAFSEVPLSPIGGKRKERELAVAFGALFATPAAPSRFGRFDEGIEQILPTYLPYDGVDASLELGVVALRRSRKDSPKTEATVHIFQGNSERLLQAAKIISDLPDNTPPGVVDTRYEPVRSFIGSFDLQASSTDQSDDLAVIAFSKKKELSNKPFFLLGKVEGDVRASFDGVNKLAALPELDPSPVARLLIEGVVVKDLVKDNLSDELVLSLPVETDGLLGSSLHRAVPDSSGWKLTTLHEAEPSVVYVGLRAADIDRDTLVDIAAMRITFESKDDPNPAYEPVVFWGKGDGELDAPVVLDLSIIEQCDASRPFLPSSLAVLETGLSPEDIVAAKKANLDMQEEDTIADRTKEIILVDPFGAYRITVDRETRTFSAPRCLEGVPGGNVVVAADITSDGIEDLLVAAPGSTYLIKGIARRP